LGEESAKEEVGVAVGDELVDHVVQAMVRAEAFDDGLEVGTVVAEAGEFLGGEGGEEELADGGYVVRLGTLGHGFAPV
jgi:hypothetical protein